MIKIIQEHLPLNPVIVVSAMGKTTRNLLGAGGALLARKYRQEYHRRQEHEYTKCFYEEETHYGTSVVRAHRNALPTHKRVHQARHILFKD